MKSIIWIGITVVVIAIVVGILLISYKAPTITPTKSTEEKSTGEVKEFVVEGSEFKFEPASITLNKDDSVKIIFKNVGGTIHNLVISELGVSTKTISPGLSDTIEFVAGKTGTFSFYCSVSGHKAAGMEGKLVVK